MRDYDFGEEGEVFGVGKGPRGAPLGDDVAEVVVEDVDDLGICYFGCAGGGGEVHGVFEFAPVVGFVCWLVPGALEEV